MARNLPPADAARAMDERNYALFLAEGEIGLFWQLSDNGLTLHDGHIAWTSVGIPREYPLTEIRSIRLQHAVAGSDTAMGLCQIRFRNGVAVIVYGGDSMGTSDATQASLYAAFVRDLHARLPEDAARRIVFHAGLSETRNFIVGAATVLGGLLMVATPLVLLFIVPSLQVLGLLAVGIGLSWPMYKLWDNNRPRHYSPRALPEELID